MKTDRTFEGVARATAMLVANHGGSARDVQAAFARNQVMRDSGNIVVTYDAFTLAGCDIRTVRLFSPKVDVFTCFAYPDPATVRPVYAMEFVQIAGKPIVAVLDLLLLIPNDAIESHLDDVMTRARRNYAGANSGDAPDWFKSCRSGRDIFVRPLDVGEFAAFERMHEEIFQHVCGLYVATAPLGVDDAALHAARINDYKHHHCANSPGLPIMEKTFGAEWTRCFMNDWVFR